MHTQGKSILLHATYDLSRQTSTMIGEIGTFRSLAQPPSPEPHGSGHLAGNCMNVLLLLGQCLRVNFRQRHLTLMTSSRKGLTVPVNVRFGRTSVRPHHVCF